jgi:ribonuclease BN (tRNA processing enzyme)
VGLRLTIIGSGNPVPSPDRFGSAYVLTVGDQRLLFDCGPATTYKLAKAGIRPTDIDHLFFTHHHFDHDVDYPCFLLSRWDLSTGGERTLSVYGPPPTETLTRRLLDRRHGAFAHDWLARIGHPLSVNAYVERGGTVPRRPPRVDARDITAGAVVEGDGWRVTTARAVHVQPFLDSIAYRVDTADGSVVITGDTAPCPEVEALARGAGTLVMQCIDLQGRLPAVTSDSMAGTQDVGRLGARAGVGRIVLVHQRPSMDRAGVPEAAVADAGSVFGGAVHFANELDVLEL